MGTFSRQSLEILRSRIDLIHVLEPHLRLQKAGSSYKALCPFHEERTPSFVIQKGDSHYHCFGCGAHGDAIQFLMTYLKMSFVEAVQFLAEKFQVELEEVEREKEIGPPKRELKDALFKAAEFYHFYLLHTFEGHSALDYLYSRGIDLDFIRTFQIGLAPKVPGLFLQAMSSQKIRKEIIEMAGLGRGREFFLERIMIPIFDKTGAIIGFSGRKYRESTFGGKYINTPETPLFKKSRVLFGIHFSRKAIAKEKKALIVEGQIDALRLIHLGFNWTVAGQGTAFGEDHVKELMFLGVKLVYLAFDADLAGQEAAVKVGQLFQKEGAEVKVVFLPEGMDPDLFLQEKGEEAFEALLKSAKDYLPFWIDHLSKKINIHSPAGKNELVDTIAKKVREWDHPLMVHETLRAVARLTQTPEAMLTSFETKAPQVYIKHTSSVSFSEIDPDRILEADLLRWLFLMGESCPKLVDIAKKNLLPHHFRLPLSRALYEKYLQADQEGSSRDLLNLAIDLEQAEQQLFLAEVLQKRVNREKALSCFVETVERLLERHWMQEREEIKLQIYSGKCSEEEVLSLARKFDLLKRERPKVQLEEEGV